VQGVHRFAARRAGGGTTVPVLVCEDGVLGESSEILAYADRHLSAERGLLTGDREVAALQRELDAGLGPAGRLWMYFQLRGHKDIAAAYATTGVPAWERRMFPLAYPLVARVIDRYLGVTPESSAAAEDIVDDAFDRIAERLSDGRRYVFTERFSAADLTFAALAAAVLMPPQYGVALPQPGELPPPMARRVQAWREHPAGVFALRMFAEERRPG
jgi:glutathione S-transferase